MKKQKNHIYFSITTVEKVRGDICGFKSCWFSIKTTSQLGCLIHFLGQGSPFTLFSPWNSSLETSKERCPQGCHLAQDGDRRAVCSDHAWNQGNAARASHELLCSCFSFLTGDGNPTCTQCQVPTSSWRKASSDLKWGMSKRSLIFIASSG